MLEKTMNPGYGVVETSQVGSIPTSGNEFRNMIEGANFHLEDAIIHMEQLHKYMLGEEVNRDPIEPPTCVFDDVRNILIKAERIHMMIDNFCTIVGAKD